MNKIYFNVGDTNFLALVNKYTYNSFVDEDWELLMLNEHWDKEAKKETF